MFGKFQQTVLRIEVPADASSIANSLLHPQKLRQWLWLQQLSDGIPEKLHPGLNFQSQLGLVKINHYVEIAGDRSLRMLLSEGIDGYHEWYWGDGWVQSRLEGISLLPLSWGQTVNLLSLQQFLGTTTENNQNC
ncbi:hypothetical protein [Merismopedia glauca]|uniref:SRPBCC family protein n=1 Tax=Merismopedia glauca CCAP 1448/3 TaxID=1296344 RepID=A0A2T1C6Z9_9CYAN|nr:hypothetical protein [Merismopedia glauca]PSB04052.1 hypothetical protein C7B64_05840 [Merismopedia glauca CCAP 1448/3]